jgi:cell division transport system ATP-binding protein
MIHLHHVSKHYGQHPALQDVTLAIGKGEFVWLTGPSGAGKTTLLRLLFGAERPTEGQIVIQGRNISKLSARQIPPLRRTMGLISHELTLLPQKTVFDNVALPLIVRGVGKRDIAQKVVVVMRATGIERHRDRQPGALSAGERQRVCIARAIVNDPLILLADEPTGALDTGLSLEIMALLRTIQIRGTTVLVATHDDVLVRDMPGREIRLESGKLVSS